MKKNLRRHLHILLAIVLAAFVAFNSMSGGISSVLCLDTGNNTDEEEISEAAEESSAVSVMSTEEEEEASVSAASAEEDDDSSSDSGSAKSKSSTDSDSKDSDSKDSSADDSTSSESGKNSEDSGSFDSSSSDSSGDSKDSDSTKSGSSDSDSDSDSSDSKSSTDSTDDANTGSDSSDSESTGSGNTDSGSSDDSSTGGSGNSSADNSTDSEGNSTDDSTNSGSSGSGSADSSSDSDSGSSGDSSGSKSSDNGAAGGSADSSTGSNSTDSVSSTGSDSSTDTDSSSSTESSADSNSSSADSSSSAGSSADSSSSTDSSTDSDSSANSGTSSNTDSGSSTGSNTDSGSSTGSNTDSGSSDSDSSASNGTSNGTADSGSSTGNNSTDSDSTGSSTDSTAAAASAADADSELILGGDSGIAAVVSSDAAAEVSTTTSSDLKDFITAISVTNAATGEELKETGNSPYTAYAFEISFAEDYTTDPVVRLAQSVSMTLPSALVYYNESGTIYNSAGTVVGTYTIDTNRLLTITFTDDFMALLDTGYASGSFSFVSYIDADEAADGLDFGVDGIDSIEIDFDTSAGLYIEKYIGSYSGDWDDEYDSETGYEFVIKLTASGADITDITVTDLLGTAFELVKVDGYDYTLYYGSLTSPTSTSYGNFTEGTTSDGSTSYTFTLDTLSEGTTVYVVYHAKYTDTVLESAFSNSALTLDNATNTATATYTANGTEGETESDTIDKEYDLYGYSWLSKSGSAAENDDGSYTITWTVVYNSSRMLSVDGKTVTDTLVDSSLSQTVASGSTVTVVRSGDDDDEDYTFTISVNNDGSWSYTFGSSTYEGGTDDSAYSSDKAYTYTFTYTTTVSADDASGIIGSAQAKNKVSDDNSTHTVEAYVTITGVDAPTKTWTGSEGDTMSWKITVSVPAAGIKAGESGAYLSDYLYVTDGSGKFPEWDLSTVSLTVTDADGNTVSTDDSVLGLTWAIVCASETKSTTVDGETVSYAAYTYYIVFGSEAVSAVKALSTYDSSTNSAVCASGSDCLSSILASSTLPSYTSDYTITITYDSDTEWGSTDDKTAISGGTYVTNVMKYALGDSASGTKSVNGTVAYSFTLNIKKLTEGDEDAETPESTVFTISGPNSTTYTVNYSDFSEDGTYTLTVYYSGDYTLTESGAEVDYYTLDTTYTDTYAGDWGTTSDQKITLSESNQTGTWTVTNTYTKAKKTGTVTLYKYISGSATTTTDETTGETTTTYSTYGYNAEFSLYKLRDETNATPDIEQDELIESGLSTESWKGYITVTGLTAGTYYFYETAAADGCFYPSDPYSETFTVADEDVDENGSVITLDDIIVLNDEEPTVEKSKDWTVSGASSGSYYYDSTTNSFTYTTTDTTADDFEVTDDTKVYQCFQVKLNAGGEDLSGYDTVLFTDTYNDRYEYVAGSFYLYKYTNQYYPNYWNTTASDWTQITPTVTANTSDGTETLSVDFSDAGVTFESGVFYCVFYQLEIADYGSSAAYDELTLTNQATVYYLNDGDEPSADYAVSSDTIETDYSAYSPVTKEETASSTSTETDTDTGTTTAATTTAATTTAATTTAATTTAATTTAAAASTAAASIFSASTALSSAFAALASAALTALSSASPASASSALTSAVSTASTSAAIVSASSASATADSDASSSSDTANYTKSYTITVTAEAGMIDSDGNLVITDSSSEELSLKLSTVSVTMQESEDADAQTLSSEACVITNNEGTLTITILKAVEGAIYTVTYSSTVAGTVNSDYTNTVTVEGSSGIVFGNVVASQIQQSSSGTTVESYSFSIYKYDSTNAAIGLPGAVFNLVDAENDNTVLKSGITTGSDGKIENISVSSSSDNADPLKKNHKYALVETSAPDGYELPEGGVRIEFYFTDGGTVTANDGVDLTNCLAIYSGDEIAVANGAAEVSTEEASEEEEEDSDTPEDDTPEDETDDTGSDTPDDETDDTDSDTPDDETDDSDGDTPEDDTDDSDETDESLEDDTDNINETDGGTDDSGNGTDGDSGTGTKGSTGDISESSDGSSSNGSSTDGNSTDDTDNSANNSTDGSTDSDTDDNTAGGTADTSGSSGTSNSDDAVETDDSADEDDADSTSETDDADDADDADAAGSTGSSDDADESGALSRTGDTAAPAVWLGVLLLSAAAAGAVLRVRRRRKIVRRQ